METLHNVPRSEDVTIWLRLVRRFRDLRVLVIGDLMLDRYIEGTASRLCREGPVPIVQRKAEELAPGGAANTAANLSALGATVSVIGLIGDDHAGNTLRQALEERDIDCGYVVQHRALRTLEKTRIVADGQYVVRLDDGQTLVQDELVARRLLANVRAALTDVDLVVISDYDYGVVSGDILTALGAARDLGGFPVTVDAKHLARYAGFKPALITPNLLEALLNAGIDHDSDDGPELDAVERVARRLQAQTGASHAAVTLDVRGVLAVDQDGRALHVGAHPVPGASTAGAGDSFLAAYSLALASGADCALCARLAVLAAGVAVTKLQTAVVTQQELLQRVSLWGQAAAPSLLRLTERLASESRQGKRVVLTNGVFDILHAGHIAFLRRARELGDILVVAVNSDASVRRIKGPGRPINGEQDRLALVAALDPVDEAILFGEDDPSMLIRALRPHIHVKGGDYAGQDLPEEAAISEIGGRFVVLPLLGDQSTTGVLSRIAGTIPAGMA